MIIYLRIYSMRSSLFDRKVFEVLLEDRGDLTVKGKGQDHLRIINEWLRGEIEVENVAKSDFHYFCECFRAKYQTSRMQMMFIRNFHPPNVI